MRGNQIVKVLKAVDLLAKPSGTTINEIAAKLKISRRSVFRMLNTVERLGIPIYDENSFPGKEKIYKLQEDYLKKIKKLPNMTIPDVNLSISEIMSLYMLKGGRTFSEVLRLKPR